MAVTSSHTFHTARGRQIPCENPDYVVVYQCELGDPRTFANLGRIVEALDTRADRTCCWEEAEVASDQEYGPSMLYLLVQDDAHVLLIVSLMLTRIHNNGWLCDDDWHLYLDEVREAYWARLGPEERAEVVLSSGGEPAMILEDDPPNDPSITMRLDLEALEFH